MGDRYGTVDVDCDCPEAIAAARHVLPETALIFGRQSKPFSHYLYRADPPVRTEQFKDPLDDRSVDGYTMATSFHFILPTKDHGISIDFREVDVDAIDQLLLAGDADATQHRSRHLAEHGFHNIEPGSMLGHKDELKPLRVKAKGLLNNKLYN